MASRFVRGLQHKDDSPGESRVSQTSAIEDLLEFVRNLDPAARVLVTRAEYARSRQDRGLAGGTTAAVYRAAKAGRISVLGPKQLLDPRLADFEWALRLNRSSDEQPSSRNERGLRASPGEGVGASSVSDATETDDARVHDPMQFAEMLAAGKSHPQAIAWVQKSLAAWINTGGSVAIERCMHLPRTESRIRLARRNVWLAKAVGAMDKESLWLRCKALSERLDQFLSRGDWRKWRERSDPPAGADPFLAALFYIARGTAADEGLSARQMYRILSDANSAGDVTVSAGRLLTPNSGEPPTD